MAHERYPTDRLLGAKQGRLGVREKEAILEKVLAGEPRRNQRTFFIPLGFATATAAALLLAIIVSRPGSEQPEFTARGGSTSAVQITCNPANSAPCRVGDKLYFRMLDVKPGTHLAAFAQSASGQIVWFFPQEEDGRTIAVPSGIVDEAPILPASLLGDSTVHIVLSAVPMTRREVREVYDEGAPASRLERSLRVER